MKRLLEFNKMCFGVLGRNSVRYISQLLDISAEVKEALNNKKAIVALESTIITHGMPFPHNYETAISVEKLIRDQGAVPATTAILKGKIKIGLSTKELEELSEPSCTVFKTSRRDFPYVLSNKLNGGTTVSGTLNIANMAGIKVFVTGGIGGVHRKGEVTFDVSSDLIELGRTPMMVVSSGVKSILDIGKTLEYLETQGVCVATLGESSEFPAFYSCSSGFNAPYHVTSTLEAAKMLLAIKNMQSTSGILLAVPIPEQHSMNGNELEETIQQAIDQAESQGIMGKEITPFILKAVCEKTEGKSLESNIALIKNNACVGGKIAVDYQNLINDSNRIIQEQPGPHYLKSSEAPIVIGGSILDCNHNLLEELKVDGRTLCGRIEQSAGGVGRNLADALGKLAPAPPTFLSALGADQFGQFLLSTLNHIDTTGIRILEGKRTATCSVVFDKKGESCLIVGDMDIHSTITCEQVASHKDALLNSPLIVVDGNIPLETIEYILKLGGENNIPIWFEPTDISKVMKPFKTDQWKNIHFMSPNMVELQEIAKGLGITLYGKLDTENKDKLLNQLLVLSVPIVQYMTSIMITMGMHGIMMVSRHESDTVIKNFERSGDCKITARYYPAQTVEGIVNVSGAGDCAAAGFMTGILKGLTEPECISIARSAALQSLQSSSAVPECFTNKISEKQTFSLIQ